MIKKCDFCEKDFENPTEWFQLYVGEQVCPNCKDDFLVFIDWNYQYKDK